MTEPAPAPWRSILLSPQMLLLAEYTQAKFDRMYANSRNPYGITEEFSYGLGSLGETALVRALIDTGRAASYERQFITPDPGDLTITMLGMGSKKIDVKCGSKPWPAYKYLMQPSEQHAKHAPDYYVAALRDEDVIHIYGYCKHGDMQPAPAALQKSLKVATHVCRITDLKPIQNLLDFMPEGDIRLGEQLTATMARLERLGVAGLLESERQNAIV